MAAEIRHPEGKKKEEEGREFLQLYFLEKRKQGRICEKFALFRRGREKRGGGLSKGYTTHSFQPQAAQEKKGSVADHPAEVERKARGGGRGSALC